MTGRMRRVNEALREVVSQGVADLKDPRIGFVTVTGVAASPDLRHALVYRRRPRPGPRRGGAPGGAAPTPPTLQTRVNRELPPKRTPQLVFEYDRSVDRGVRLSKLLDELSSEPDAGGAAQDR